MPTWRGQEGLPSLSSRPDIQCRGGAKAALVMNRTKKVKKAEMAATTNQPASKKENTSSNETQQHLWSATTLQHNTSIMPVTVAGFWLTVRSVTHCDQAQ